MLIDVVSAPLTTPAAKAGALPPPPGAADRARWCICQPAASTTAAPTATWSTGFESASSASTPSARPGSAATSIGASSPICTSWRPESSSTSTLSGGPSSSIVVTAS